MTLLDIEVDLSDEAQSIRDTVHKFAEEAMRPAGDALGDVSTSCTPMHGDEHPGQQQHGGEGGEHSPQPHSPRSQARSRALRDRVFLLISSSVGRSGPRVNERPSGRPRH